MTGATPVVDAPDDSVLDALTRVLVRACRALADAGEPARAGRLAADGWAVVRHLHPRQARHLDGAMHHAARAEESRDRLFSIGVASTQQTIREGSAISDEHAVLDVRPEPPKRRHELIFDTFAELPVGEAYELVNDHDPKPLYYQLTAENPGEFSWRYLEEGPEVWRVLIGRTAQPGVPASS